MVEYARSPDPDDEVSFRRPPPMAFESLIDELSRLLGPSRTTSWAGYPAMRRTVTMWSALAIVTLTLISQYTSTESPSTCLSLTSVLAHPHSRSVCVAMRRVLRQLMLRPNVGAPANADLN